LGRACQFIAENLLRNNEVDAEDFSLSVEHQAPDNSPAAFVGPGPHAIG